MSEILTLLEKLDTPRAQVMIEAAIVEAMGASSFPVLKWPAAISAATARH